MTKTEKGQGRLPTKINIGFYSRKYGKHFKTYESFKKYDEYMKKMYVLEKHNTYNNKNYSTPKLRKQLEEYNNEKRKIKRLRNE